LLTIVIVWPTATMVSVIVEVDLVIEIMEFDLTSKFRSLQS
jgi:hypothetical protein